MEPQKTKIALYVKRSFGEKLGASFDFIKEHWKLLLKFSTASAALPCPGIELEWVDTRDIGMG